MIKDETTKKDICLNLLKSMLRIRAIEMKIADEYKEKEIRCPVHLSVGQEAPSAALSLLVDKNDFSVSTHRGHAHYLAKGGDLKKMIAELYGKATGCSRGKGGSMHLIDTDVNFMGTSAIVGNSIPTGTGLAHAAMLNGLGQVSVIHIGDGAIEEGSFYESLNFASLKKLPALYLCENNLYSVYSPMEVRQPEGRSLKTLVESIGVKGLEGDGNEAYASYNLLQQAFEHCRSGNGPIFLELKTYRWLEHCGPNNDDHLAYRSKEEINSWREKDPINLIKDFIGEDSSDSITKFKNSIDNEIEEAFEFAKNSPVPDENLINKNIYSEE